MCFASFGIEVSLCTKISLEFFTLTFPVSTEYNLGINSDVLATLKATGKGYQTKINDILRQAVLG